jgi:hypothetical protein
VEHDPQRSAAAELPTPDDAPDALAARLIESEQQLASMPELKDRLDRALAENEVLRAELNSTTATLNGVTSSPSWRLTEPLRWGRRLLKPDGTRSR